MTIGTLCSTRRSAMAVFLAPLFLALLPLSSLAQVDAGAKGDRGTQVLFLGTAGGPPLHRDRSEPSTLLLVDGRAYLIDCGMGTMQRMLQAGIQSEAVRTIFFTHLHSDHDLGLADVMANDLFQLNLKGSADSIDIYGPPQTKELVDNAFRYITVSVRPFVAENPAGYRRVNDEVADPFVTHEFARDGVVFQDDKVRVTAAENTHYAFMPEADRAQMKSYAYRVETPHGTIVFTGDTGPSDAVARLAQGADMFVAEASVPDEAHLLQFVNAMAARNHWPPQRTKTFRAHMEAEHLNSHTIGELAAKAKVKSVMLYHYTPSDQSETAAYISGVKQYFPGPVFAPNDLERYCLQASPGAAGSTTIAKCGD